MTNPTEQPTCPLTGMTFDLDHVIRKANLRRRGTDGLAVLA
jgi:hypothetical protein